MDSEIREAAAAADQDASKAEAPKVVTRTRITADGTYATESVYTAAPGWLHGPESAIHSTAAAPVKHEKPTLRKLLLEGDFFLAAAFSSTLVKLALHYQELADADAAAKHKVLGETLLILASILHLGKSGLPTTAIDEDSQERILARDNDCLLASLSHGRFASKCCQTTRPRW